MDRTFEEDVLGDVDVNDGGKEINIMDELNELVMRSVKESEILK